MKLESAGTYIGTVTESAVTLTKAGKPQWAARLKATQKYIESKEDIAHFQQQGLLQDGNPAYVDWTAFDEEIVAFLLLFNSVEEISPQTAMKNVEQLSLATGWVAPDFESIGQTPVLGATILFRVQEKKPYLNDQGKTVGGDGTLEVSWIDHKDASPERQLKSADADQIKGLLAKVTGYSNKPAAAKPAPAKPVLTKPAAPVASAPTQQTTAPVVAGAVPAPATAAQPAAVPVTTTAPAAPKTRKKAPAPAPAPTPVPVATPTPAPAVSVAQPLPAETTMEAAWEFVNINKGGKEDSQVEEAWLGSITGDPSAMTGADWAKVRDTTMQKLAA